MKKIILTGGYMYKAEDGGRAFCEELVSGIKNKPVKILDCLFGYSEQDWLSRFLNDKDFLNKNLDNIMVELATHEKFIEQIKKTDVVFFQGGRPQDIISELEKINNWKEEIKGKTIVASSGGADIFAKYYGVGKTLRVGEGLGLLPIKFIPHWESDYGKDLSIDWEKLYSKLESHSEDLEIVKLRDGEYRVFES